MKGLLLKDILNLKQQAKLYLIVIAVWLVIGISNQDANFFVGLILICALFFPISATAYDEKAKWDRYVLTMPVSKSDIVMSKYLLSLLCALMGSVISLIAGIAISSDLKETLLSFMFFISLALILLSIVLPAIFKYGVEKGRIIIILVFLIPTLFGLAFSKLDIPLPSEKILMQVIYFSPVISIVFILCSISISKRIYAHKEF